MDEDNKLIVIVAAMACSVIALLIIAIAAMAIFAPACA